MNIRIPLKHVLKHAPELVPDYMQERSKQRAGAEKEAYINNQVVEINNAHELDGKLLETFRALLMEDWKAKSVPGVVGMLDDVRKVIRYQDQPDAANRTVSDLDSLTVGLKDAILASSPDRRWIYREMEDGTFCPAYVAQIEFHPRRGIDRPAYVSMDLVWTRGGKTQNMKISFSRSSVSKQLEDEGRVGGDADYGEEVVIGGGDDEEVEESKKKTIRKKVSRKISEILHDRRLALETPNFFEAYKASIPKYGEYRGKLGVVVRATGKGYYANPTRDYNDETKYVARVREIIEDGVSSDLVVDDLNTEKIPFKSTYSFWSFSEPDEDRGSYTPSDFWKKKSYSLPFHPYILLYDLRKHCHVWVHAEQIQARDFEQGISDKLVIPQRDKKFIDTLMNSTNVRMEDIISGKSGGVFILSEGCPGVGKTLTAEIYAESMQRPLYTVQCSQLGINPEQIEQRLRAVLVRAQRWGAVLLLDEADVYIRARDTDVQHNAIVGVMLRVIEYYSGLLFMTTNLSNIDDAICSRATAHIIYKAPGVELLEKIWLVLAKQFGLALTPKDCATLAKTWPKAVGRDVKNLIKLTRLSGETASVHSVVGVSHYLDMEKKKATDAA